MTATADRFLPGRSREELRLVSVASGLLMLLDAYRLTGRLPLEVQVQASRLRHAVKVAIHAQAIPAAARYLVDHGARRNLDRAIHAYNHSWAYVAKVKQLARRYTAGGGRR